MTCMLLAAVVAAAMPTIAARADGIADLQAAMQELNKSEDQQDAALIDAKLASAVAAPGDLQVYQYRQARMLQEQRRVAAIVDTTAPERRDALNDGYATIAREIGDLYLPDVTVDPSERFEAYRQQLIMARQISLSTQADALAEDVATAMQLDLDARYLADEQYSDAQKSDAIAQARRAALAIPDTSMCRDFEMGLLTRMIALDTPEGKQALIDRAKLHADAGDLTAAIEDFNGLLQNVDATEDIKNLARFERMRILVAQNLWSDALADAEALAALDLDDASANSAVAPLVAADAKRQAIRVKFANGQLTDEQLTAAIDSLWLEMLTATNCSAQEKSDFLTETALERARQLGARQQWQQALAWAKAAYMIAPYRHVGGSVTLIQQLLANRSRMSFAVNATVAKNRADLAAAEAFYARQSGLKEVPNADGTATTKVTLAADLSNDADFPRQIEAVATPLAGELRTSVEQVAANHSDLQTRALAWGLLCDADNAITLMSDAIDALELESGQTSDMVNFVARFVRGKFESVALANAFLASQVDGPAGEDGQLGTEDDKPNPLTAAQE
jgi:hypothetical protein